MKILHICLAAFYIDNYGYQENILPKFHQRMGHEVKILASTETYTDNKELSYVEPSTYLNKDGILVQRIRYSRFIPSFLVKKLRIYEGLNSALVEFRPDLIFLHDVQFLSILNIVKFLKQYPHCKLIADGHADFVKHADRNILTNFVSQKLLHGVIYKYCAKSIEDLASKFFGVLPIRVRFFTEVYDINPTKVELLEMGADDDLIPTDTNKVRKDFCSSLGLDFQTKFIVTGGKIDGTKKIENVLEGFGNAALDNSIKLVVFGLPNAKLESMFNRMASSICNVIYLGWLEQKQIYNLISIAEIIVFPGTHSVLWEQTAGIGKPMLVRRWKDIEHINVEGNLMWLEEGSSQEINHCLCELFDDSNNALRNLQRNADSNRLRFLYSEISKRSINL